jgi:hypothetical protein
VSQAFLLIYGKMLRINFVMGATTNAQIVTDKSLFSCYLNIIIPNEEILLRIKEQGNILHKIIKRKAN